jgi:hypothetical protein
MAPAQQDGGHDQRLSESGHRQKRHGITSPRHGFRKQAEPLQPDGRRQCSHRDPAGPQHETTRAEQRRLDRHDRQPKQQWRRQAAGRARQRHDEESERGGREGVRLIEAPRAGDQRDGKDGERGSDDHRGLEGTGRAAPGQISRSEAEHAAADEQARQNETFVTLPFRRVRLHRCMHQCRRLCPQCCDRHTERNALLSRIPPSAECISP